MPVWRKDAGTYCSLFACVCVFPINLAGVVLARLACVLEIGQKQRSSGNGQHMGGWSTSCITSSPCFAFIISTWFVPLSSNLLLFPLSLCHFKTSKWFDPNIAVTSCLYILPSPCDLVNSSQTATLLTFNPLLSQHGIFISNISDWWKSNEFCLRKRPGLRFPWHSTCAFISNNLLPCWKSSVYQSCLSMLKCRLA